MYYFTTVLMFTLILGYMASNAVRALGSDAISGKLFCARLAAERKSMNIMARNQWKGLGDLVDKVPKKPQSQGRYLPVQRLDILPIFSEKNSLLEALLEAFIVEQGLMDRDLFKAWISRVKHLFVEMDREGKKDQFNERTLHALEFENEAMRHRYYHALKGSEKKPGLFDLIKVHRANGKIPIHQISRELRATLFVEESQERVRKQAERVRKDPKAPLWTAGDLLMLKTKNPLWRDLLDTHLYPTKDSGLFEKISVDGASINRIEGA